MSFTRSDASESSFYAAIPDPWDKCRFTTCFSLHTSTASSCPYKLCPECRELVTLDAQIAEAHNVLINLAQKRHKLKERINRRHDQLTSRLPVEIILHIFNLIASEPRTQKRYSHNPWNAVVLIGAVCKRWRDMSLGMPQLWTKFLIDPWNHIPSLEITKQWLSRSRELPLSLEVNTIKEKCRTSEFGPSSENVELVQLLRSQASRWKDLKVVASKEVFRRFLHRLEDRVNLDSLTIYVGGDFRVGIDNITMQYPFVPKTLDITFIPVPVLPVNWDWLTHLSAKYIQVDEVLYIFRSAHNLRTCSLGISPKAKEGHYPLPVSPSICDSVTYLSTTRTEDSSKTRHFIRHLTLPSLETLSYALTQTFNRKQLDTLIDFLERSRPPLQGFYLSYRDKSPAGPANIDWYRSLSSLTSLELSISSSDDPDEENLKLQAYVQALNADLVPMALPHLEELRISASGVMNIETWDALADVFPDSETDADNASPLVPRPLKKVTISINFCWEDMDIMRRSTYRRLRKIRESGVELMVYDEDNCDLLDGLYPECFTFLEDDEDYDEGSGENSESEEEWDSI